MNNETFTTNTSVNDTIFRYNGSVQHGATFNESGDGIDFDDDSTNKLNFSGISGLNGSLSGFTIIFKSNFNYPTLTTDRSLFNWGANPNGGGFDINNNGNDGVNFWMDDSSCTDNTGASKGASGAGYITQDSNTTYTLSYNGSAINTNRIKMYRNSTEISVTMTETMRTTLLNCPHNLIIGKTTTANAWGNTMSYLVFLNTTIGLNEVSQFTEGGDFDRCSKITAYTNPSTFTINSKNIYDNTKITSFSVILFNSTYSLNTSTTIGQIQFNDTFRGNYSLNISSNENGGYINRTYPNLTINTIETEQTFNADLYQAMVYITSLRRGTNVSINDFNITLPKTFNSSNNTGGLRLYLNASNYEATIKSEDYFIGTLRLNISNQSISRAEAEFYDINLTITLYSIVENIYIKNFTTRLIGNGSYFSYNQTSINNGNTTYSIGNNTYYIYINATGYSILTQSFILYSNNTYPNLTFSLYTSNSLNITFLDELTEDRVTNVSYVLIGTDISINTTTQNGSAYLSQLAEGEYRIVYERNDYSQRNYYFTFLNQNHSEVVLYMLSKGNTTATTLTITDLLDNELVGYYSYLLRYFTTSGTYKTLEIIKTDENGQVKHSIILNNLDRYYKWQFKTPSGALIKTTEGHPIYLTSLNYKLQISPQYLEKYQQIQSISGGITIDNATGVITYFYSDDSGLNGKNCLKVEKLGGFSNTKLFDTCETSASGTISYTITDFSLNYRATGYTIQEGSLAYNIPIIFLDILYKTDWKYRFAGTGLLMEGLFVMALSTIGFSIGGIFMAIIMSVVGMGVFVKLGIVALSTSVLISILIFAIVLTFKVKR